MERHGSIGRTAPFQPEKAAETLSPHSISLTVLLQLPQEDDRKSSEQQQASMEDYVKYSSPLNALNRFTILGLMRESSALLRLNSSALIWIMFILIFPLSAVLLSYPCLLLQLVRHSYGFDLQRRLHDVAASIGILHSFLLNRFFHFAIFKFVVCYGLSSPMLFTFWLLAKAFTTFTVSATYATRKPSLQLFVSVGPKLWRRLLYTYGCAGCCGAVAFAIAALALAGLAALGRALSLPANAMLASEMVMGVGGSVVLGNALLCAEVATVVCVLEESIGMAAMARGIKLMKGRRQVGLWMVLVTAGSLAMVESLYESRVIGLEGGRYEVSASSRLWEAPLLICMHSFLLLYHAIMTTVFYFACKEGCPPSP